MTLVYYGYRYQLHVIVGVVAVLSFCAGFFAKDVVPSRAASQRWFCENMYWQVDWSAVDRPCRLERS